MGAMKPPQILALEAYWGIEIREGRYKINDQKQLLYLDVAKKIFHT